jgi:mannitol/fructose-specific phosphotransferase system IIA component (Ntr-type)
MSDIKSIKLAKRKQESRDIAKKIIDFGVTEDQKVDIMFNLALTLENNTSMKEITSVLKKFIEKFNNDEEEDNNSTKGKLIV